MLTDLKTTFLLDLDDTEQSEEGEIHVATGEAAYPLMSDLAKKAQSVCKNLTVNVVSVKNRLFGEKITVAGLICGADFFDALKDLPLGDELLIPAVSLRREGDMFLDDMTLCELSDKLRVKVTPVENDGFALLNKLAGKE